MSERRGRDPFLIPGRTDASMAPRLGSLSIRAIAGLGQVDLDARIAQHLRGGALFKPGVLMQASAARRLQLKRELLALMEGHSPSSPEFIAWKDASSDPEHLLANPANRVQVDKCSYASVQASARIREVRRTLVRETIVKAPSPQEQRLLGSINHVLVRTGLPVLTLETMLTHINISPHTVFTVPTLLRVYDLRLRGMSHADIEHSLGLTKGTSQVMLYRHFTPRAKEALRAARGKR